MRRSHNLPPRLRKGKAMRVPHPIPYQGSKRNLAGMILPYMPADTKRIIEPFAGSAAVSLASAHGRQASYFLLNDINQPLIDLWQAIIEEPEAVASAYAQLWQEQQGQEREYYDQMRARFNRTQDACLFLYLLARCAKASVRYNSSGEFNQSPDNRRQGAHPDTMRAHILGASRLMQGKTQLRCGLYSDVLTDIHANDLMYMDPPYQGVCGERDRRYKGGIDANEFVDFLRLLNRNNISYILSYDGQTGGKLYGKPLPSDLQLRHILLAAGRSSQATLLGRDEKTVESLYLSPALVLRLPTLVSVPGQGAQTSFAEALL